jgi:general secretion pathway protein G
MRLVQLKKNQLGFTLIELLVVITIIGIIATIAIPNLLNATQRARQRRTMGDMKTIANAIAQYLQDNSIVPLGGSIGTIVTTPNTSLNNVLIPTYITAIPDRDGWGNPFRYIVSSRDSYTLESRGRDGINNVNATRNDQNWDHDLMLSNGIFIASPDSGT